MDVQQKVDNVIDFIIEYSKDIKYIERPTYNPSMKEEGYVYVPQLDWFRDPKYKIQCFELKVTYPLVRQCGRPINIIQIEEYDRNAETTCDAVLVARRIMIGDMDFYESQYPKLKQLSRILGDIREGVYRKRKEYWGDVFDKECHESIDRWYERVMG